MPIESDETSASAPGVASPRSPGGLPREGDLVDGKYRIEALLGQGGMGAVFRATHAHTGRAVALKVVVPAYARDEQFLRRFEREARAAGSLRHTNIVDVTDFGYATTPRGRLAYLVMEYLDGCSLAEVLRQQEGLPLAWSVDVLEQIGAAVEEAHRAGLLHRDLKPDNIWLEPNRKGGYTIKVLDFGLAKLATRESAEEPPRTQSAPAVSRPADRPASTAPGSVTPPSAFDEDAATGVRPSPSPAFGATAGADTEQATEFGAIVGTPAYMSPEQCRGAALTPASDVYSLAVIAYRMLSGKLPFEGGPDRQIAAHIGETPRAIGDLRRDLPADAGALVMQGLSKDPSARPRSAGAFAAMLHARCVPTSEFLRTALFLFLQHFRTFFEASIFWSSPALVAGAAVALAAILESTGRATGIASVPPNALIFIPQILGLFGVFAMQGALVPAVMQAIVAPLQPIDLRSLQKTFRARMRRYLRGIVPLIGLLALFFLWVFTVVMILPLAIQPFRETLRSLPRPLVVLGLMAAVMPITIAPLLLFRKTRVGSAFQFLGAVAVMEGRSGKAALERSAELAGASGRALKAVMVATMGLGFLAGAGFGMLSIALPRGLPTWAFAAIQVNVITLGMTTLAPFLSIVSALTYLRALKANGESPDDVLRAFEREILPPSHWKLATRERILTQIDSTRG